MGGGPFMVTPFYADEAITLYCGDCRDVLPTLPQVDHVVTDPPYSERTHAGHDASNREGFGRDGADRRALGYSAWTTGDVETVVPQLCRVSRGWVAVMTDHVLAVPIQDAMRTGGRVTFAPLPWYVPGRTVRLVGDGPSSWTTWIVVSRTKAQRKWGTLPGGYTQGGEQYHMGGKPEALMLALVADYSRAGDTILDPAKRLGRKAIGIELNPAYCDVIVSRLRQGSLLSPEVA
jgi:DNA modification methylase